MKLHIFEYTIIITKYTINNLQATPIVLLSLLNPVFSSFGGSHDHSHGHHHGDDIHSGHFCWDVSKWGKIFYKEIEIPVSDTKFEMGCKDVPKTVNSFY